MKLTRSNIKELKPRAKSYDARDSDLKGFLARVSPAGRITYYFQYKSPVKGRQINYWIGVEGTVNATQARDSAERLAARVALGECPQSDKTAIRAEAEARKDITFGEFIKTRYAPYAESHLEDGKTALGRIKRNFGFLYNRELSGITSWSIESWRTKRLRSGISKSTVNRDINSLRGALTKAVKWKHIDHHPLSELDSIKVDKKRKPRYLSDTEREALQHAITSAPDYLQAMVSIGLNTGLRRGELFHLEWSDIDFSTKTVTIRGEGAKSGQTRHIPLNATVLHCLNWWRDKARPSHLLFANRKDEPYDNVKRSWASLIKAAGIERFRFHDMRHDFASRLVMQGVPLNTVRDLLGHASIETTLIYAHLAPDTKARAVSVLDDTAAIHGHIREAKTDA